MKVTHLFRSISQGLSPGYARCFSSVGQTQKSTLRKACLCPEDDPRNHTLSHAGLYYKVPDSEMKTMMNSTLTPPDLRLMETFNEKRVMIRQPSLEVIGYLKNLNYNYPVPRFVFYGRTGAGKMFCLFHTIHFCAKSDWIVVHVPWANKWNNGYRVEIHESTFKPGRYDQPADGVAWLNLFRLQNGDKIKDIKTTSEYIWTKREKAEAGIPLNEIIDFGINRARFSTDCVGVVLKELRQQAAIKGFKVLVAVNMINTYIKPYERKAYLQNTEGRVLQATEVSLVRNFKKMLSPTWTNGAVVGSINERGYYMKPEEYEPQYLFGDEGFEWMDPFVPIYVPEYSEKEALRCLHYYRDRNWIQNDYGNTEEGMQEIMFVSNRNPESMADICSRL